MFIPILTGSDLRVADYVQLDARLPIPDNAVCFSCKKRGVELHRCSGCHTFYYCSRECQKRDWKNHKTICTKYLMQSAFGDRLEDAIEQSRDQKLVRTTANILGDLARTVEIHRTYVLVPVCWFALALDRDMNKSTTHFVAITLSRNFDSPSDRTLYSLVDADVLPLSILEEKSIREHDKGPGVKPYNPAQHFFGQRERMLKDASKGVIGGALVVCIELSPKDKTKFKTVREAVIGTPCDCFYSWPQVLFTTARDVYKPLNLHQSSQWKACLKNALNGFAFSPIQQKLSPRAEQALRNCTVYGHSA
ncbi:hypothetical protein C8F01DRAFT_1161975 [Mycena amicta]|nr:hypothetical protein C8F01DRAFT_1161975 [Mycena amicta]